MMTLDDIIKSAKPAVPDLPADFSRRVMIEIEKTSLATQPTECAQPPVKSIHLTGAIVLWVLGLVIVNQFIFEIRMNGGMELLYFGTRFLADAVSYVPFDLIVPALVVTMLSSWLMWNSHAIKRGIVAIFIGSFLTTTFGGAVLAASGINERIRNGILREEREWPLLSWFFKERARFCVDHPNFRMGRVEKSDSRLVSIIDPNGKKTKVELPSGMSVKEGQIIRLAGSESGDIFRVNSGHHCNPGRVGRYFGRLLKMPHGGGTMESHLQMRCGEGMKRRHNNRGQADGSDE